MKRRMLPVIVMLTLASGIGTAAAADHSAMSKHSSMTKATQPMAKDRLSLTSSDRKLAWTDLGKWAISQNTPASFVPAVGATLPSTIAVKTVPMRVSGKIPVLKPYDYALLKNELLIVNPTDKKIVDVINRRA